MAEYYSMECMYVYNFLNHSPIVGHLFCFHNLAVVKKAAINMSVQIPLLLIDLHSFGYMSKIGIVESFDNHPDG
jgi:hypothetical protein